MLVGIGEPLIGEVPRIGLVTTGLVTTEVDSTVDEFV
jgi:hypothetical protein